MSEILVEMLLNLAQQHIDPSALHLNTRNYPGSVLKLSSLQFFSSSPHSSYVAGLRGA